MNDLVESLEAHAGELKEHIETESVIIQEKLNQAIDYGQESRVYSLRRGEARRRIDELEDVYEEAEAVISIGEALDLVYPEEHRQEEVRLAKEKWFESNLNNPYEGSIGQAMEEHLDQQLKARNQELLTHSTPMLDLRRTLSFYEILLYEAGEKIDGLDVETPYSPQMYDSVIIDESPEENPDESLELSDYLFS